MCLDALPASGIGRTGLALVRYGLVWILLYLGSFKFTAVEAEAIQPLVANSPILAWLYVVFDLQQVSNVFGTIELAIAVCIAARPVAPAMSAAGSLAAAGMFLATLSFLATTPGVWTNVAGYPLPFLTSTGWFLAKDVFLLGGALVTAAEAAHRSMLVSRCPRSASPCN